MTATSVRRIRSRVHDQDLRCDRIIGAGWTWECACGAKGSWEPTREEALEQARVHKLFKHGQR